MTEQQKQDVEKAGEALQIAVNNTAHFACNYYTELGDALVGAGETELAEELATLMQAWRDASNSIMKAFASAGI